MASMSSLMLWPVIPFVLELLVTALFVFVALSLRTISDPVGTVDDEFDSEIEEVSSMSTKDSLRDLVRHIPCNPQLNDTAGHFCRFLYYGNKKYTIYLQFFNLFMYFWLFNFVQSLTEMTLAGTYVYYYFSRLNKKLMPCCPLVKCFAQSLYFHTGSLALGSFLIALFRMVRAVLEYIDSKVKSSTGFWTQYFLKCFMCCLWCLEKFVRFLNRNAFIMIAIYGQSFCTAAHSAVHLLARNFIRFYVVNMVANFVLFISKLVIVGMTACLAYLCLNGNVFDWFDVLSPYRPNVFYEFIPFILIIVISYVMATFFLNIYEMGVDTIFFCFLIDLDMNDGSIERPYYMSKRLMRIMRKTNASLTSVRKAEKA